MCVGWKEVHSPSSETAVFAEILWVQNINTNKSLFPKMSASHKYNSRYLDDERVRRETAAAS